MDTEMATAEKQRNNSHLMPYDFKPGQSGNPKGRPRAIMTKKERLEVLTEIARHTIESPVSAGHKIAAIREANLIEGVYQVGTPIDARTLNIYLKDKDTYQLIQQSLGRTGQLKVGEEDTKVHQDDTESDKSSEG